MAGVRWVALVCLGEFADAGAGGRERLWDQAVRERFLAERWQYRQRWLDSGIAVRAATWAGAQAAELTDGERHGNAVGQAEGAGDLYGG
jgi:hypothetical protein